MTKTRTDKADSMNAKRKTSARHASDLDATVADLLFRLDCVTDDDDAGYHLAHVFGSVADQAGGIGRITPRQCDQLLRSICIARAKLPWVFPVSTSAVRMSANRGFDALEALVMWWADTPDRRAWRRDDFLLDMLTYARMYRNDLENAVLARDVCRRFDQRRVTDGRTVKIAAGTRKLIGAA